MKKLIHKLSLRAECILASSILFLLFVILYFIYVGILRNTGFYQAKPTLANFLYWFFATPLYVTINVILIDKLTDPIKSFIGYIKEFQDINFQKVAESMHNSDYIKLSNALNNLQMNLFTTIKELTDKNKEILRLNDEQQKEFIYKRSLVSSISHDIKTPLTIIHATISGIRDGIFSEEEIPKELDNVLFEIERTTSMLQDTIGIYRMESEVYQMKLEDFQLIDTITNVTDNFKKLFEKYEQTLVLNLPVDIKVHGDKEKFERVINNLIMNAIIHSPKGNNISINIVSNARNNILEIINTGVTIPDDELKNIFKPFYRLDKSRTKQDDHGNGLGLYIAQEIIKKHGFELGVVNLENAVKFYIVFPKEN